MKHIIKDVVFAYGLVFVMFSWLLLFDFNLAIFLIGWFVIGFEASVCVIIGGKNDERRVREKKSRNGENADNSS